MAILLNTPSQQAFPQWNLLGVNRLGEEAIPGAGDSLPTLRYQGEVAS